MATTANLPAAPIAVAAAAYATRQRQTAETDGVASVNFVSILDAEALAALAAASGDGLIAVSRDDFALIRADYQPPGDAASD